MLQCNEELMRIDLGGNHLGASGGEALGGGLAGNSTLERISLLGGTASCCERASICVVNGYLAWVCSTCAMHAHIHCEACFLLLPCTSILSLAVCYATLLNVRARVCVSVCTGADDECDMACRRHAGPGTLRFQTPPSVVSFS